MPPKICYAPSIAVGRIVEEMALVEDTEGLDQPATQVLMSCLGINNEQLFFRFLPLVEKAIIRNISVLQRKEVRLIKDEYISSLKLLSDAFFPLNLAVNWRDYKRTYLKERTVIHAIGACNAIVARSNIHPYPENMSEEHIGRIDELLLELASAESNEFIRDFLIEELKFMKLAIQKFDYFGPDGVQVAFGAILSACYRHEEVVKANWAGKLGAVLMIGATIVGFAVDLDALPDVISKRSEEVMKLIGNKETKLLEYKDPSDGVEDKLVSDQAMERAH